MSVTFASLGVPEQIAAALAKRGITEPFPIQAATIPDALAGKDLCGKAPTGSGKTIAFGIPMLARVTRSAPKRPKGLVLAPTRELAIQVADELRAMSGELRVMAVYGGAGIEPQIKRLRAGVDIVCATPGRLIDLIDRNVCDLRDVSFAVVDEADRMADMGFLPDVKRILDLTKDDRQTVLFSATLDGAIDQLVKRYQRNPVIHEMPDEPSGDVTHNFWVSNRPDRVALLAQLVDRLGPTVVFCRTKHGSDRVARQLGNAGIKAAAIHGNRSQAQRERALEAFHRGDVQALVATDVAARGIHVEGVLGVVHFDLPADHKDYIHRSGRTGRAGGNGTVVTLIDPGQRKDTVKLKKAAGIDAEIGEPDVASLPEGPQQRFRPAREKSRVRDLDTGGSRERRPSKPREERRPERSSDRTSRPAREGSRDRRDAPAGRRDRPGRNERNERSEREPKPPRVVETWDDSGSRSVSQSRTNRAERRANQFTEEERAARAEENAKRERKRSSSPKRSSRPSGGSSGSGSRPSSGDRSLPAATPGAAKVRPSGASRRKAKRETLVAAGEPVGPSKKRRSGKPRPPASGGKGRRG